MTLLRRILYLLGVDELPDPAWKPTGYTYRHTGHDESKARARWEQQEAEAAAWRESSTRARAKANEP